MEHGNIFRCAFLDFRRGSDGAGMVGGWHLPAPAPPGTQQALPTRVTQPGEKLFQLKSSGLRRPRCAASYF